MKIKTQYIRRDSLLLELGEEGFMLFKDLKSNNKSKKESRRLQQANGGLGMGYVQLG